MNRHLEALQCLRLEYQEGTTILQNVGNYLPVGTMLTSHKNGIFSYAAVRTSNFISLDVSMLRMCIAFAWNRTYKVKTNYIQTTLCDINYSQLLKYEALNSILICSVYKVWRDWGWAIFHVGRPVTSHTLCLVTTLFM